MGIQVLLFQSKTLGSTSNQPPYLFPQDENEYISFETMLASAVDHFSLFLLGSKPGLAQIVHAREL